MSVSQQVCSRLGGALTKLPVQWLEGKDQIATVFGSKLCVFSGKTGQLVKGIEMNINCNKTAIVAFRVNPSRDFEEAYVIDSTGLLTGIDLRSQLIFKEQRIEGIDGILAAFFNDDASKIFILDRQTKLFTYKIAKNNLKFIAQLTKPSQENEQQTNQAFLELTSAQNYAIIASAKTILLVDIEDQKVFRTILHPRNITAVSTSNSTIAIGDDMGKITYYHHAYEQTVELHQKDFTSSSVHWHSQAVKSLAFNQDASLLFSGGEEGVLIVWHQLEDKRDFYPRLGSEIAQLSVSPGNEVVACSLLENSIQFLKISNFETSFSVQGFTNPAAYPSASLTKSAVFLKTIHQSEDTHLICLNSLPGKIQFISLFEERKIKDLDIIARNLTSRSGSYLPDPASVTSVAFDKTWKHMATITQRDSSEISLSALKFWHETSNLTYEANTRIEYPHGNHTFEVIAFFSKKTHSTKFLTFGSDNKFKIWNQQARKVPDSKTGEGKIHEYFWNCEMEGMYKNKKILGVQHTYDADDNDILAVITDGVLLKWNLSSKVIEKTVKIPLKGEIIRFECSDACEVLFILSTNALTIVSSESGAILFNLEMDKFLDLAIDRSSNQLSVLAISPELKSSVVVTFSTKDFSVVQAFSLANSLDRICYTKTLTNHVLVGLDKSMNFFVFADKSIQPSNVRKYISEGEINSNNGINGEQATEEEQLKNQAYLAQPAKQQVSYSQKYQASLAYMFRHDFRTVADFYSEKSHLIPPSTLVFSQFFDTLMIKNTQNKQNNFTADKLTSANMDIESDNSSEDEDDEEDIITFEKQGQKESNNNIEDSNSNIINSNNNNLGSKQGVVNDKWIKDTHKYIENIFAVSTD